MGWTRTVTESTQPPGFRYIKVTTVLFKYPGVELTIGRYQQVDNAYPHAFVLKLQEDAPYPVYNQCFKGQLCYKNVESMIDLTHYYKSYLDMHVRKNIIDIFVQHYKLKYSEVHNDLYKLLGLKPSNNMILHELLALVEADKATTAFQQAVALQQATKPNFAVIWLLAENLYARAEENLFNLQSVYDLYKQISETSPYFNASREKMLEILQQRCVDKDNAIPLLEQKFILALSIKDTRLASRYFDELAGYPFSATPTFPDLSLDPNFLLQLAAALRKVNARNRILEAENLALRQQVKELQANNDNKFSLFNAQTPSDSDTTVDPQIMLTNESSLPTHSSRSKTNG